MHDGTVLKQWFYVIFSTSPTESIVWVPASKAGANEQTKYCDGLAMSTFKVKYGQSVGNGLKHLKSLKRSFYFPCVPQKTIVHATFLQMPMGISASLAFCSSSMFMMFTAFQRLVGSDDCPGSCRLPSSRQCLWIVVWLFAALSESEWEELVVRVLCGLGETNEDP